MSTETSQAAPAASTSAGSKAVPEYTTNFLNSLGIMKVGAILFFLLEHVVGYAENET
jgi:hypothetical protein